MAVPRDAPSSNPLVLALDSAQRLGQSVSLAVADTFRGIISSEPAPVATEVATAPAEEPLPEEATVGVAASSALAAALTLDEPAPCSSSSSTAAAAASAEDEPTICEEEPTILPSASWTLSGEALHTATVGQVATFSIESFDATGARRLQGGDKFAVTLSGASTVRVKTFDEGDGRYTCEFRCPSSGKYRLSVQTQSVHLPGSPFVVNVKSNSLKEWKAHRAKEAAEKRREKEQQKAAAKSEKVRAPSPRINPYDQLQKAYELALQAARGGLGSVSSRGHYKNPATPVAAAAAQVL